MDKLDALMEEAKTLPANQQIKLISMLSASLALSFTPKDSDDFWQPKSLKVHQAEQQIMPLEDLRQASVDFWPDEESSEAFLTYTRRQRKEALGHEV